MQSALRATLFALPLVFCSSTALQAQDLFEGFSRTDEAKPSGTYRTLSSGDSLGFDGLDVVRYASDGTVLSTIALSVPDPSVGAFLFPSFVAVSPDETMAFVGRTGCDSSFVNCSFGDLWFVDLLSEVATLHGPLTSNFDGILFDNQTAYVNAKPCAFGCANNEIHRVVAGTLGSTVVVSLVSEAGPVEMDAVGNLYVATVDANFPPQPGGTDLYWFAAADLAGGTTLTEADGFVLSAGLDGAVDLALDAGSGDVLLAGNFYQTDAQGEDATLNRIYAVTLEGQTHILYDGELGQTLSNLEVTDGDGSARMFGYQPASGGSFHFRSSEFVTFTSFDRTYTPQRPTLTASATGTTATLSVASGGAGDLVLFLYGPASFALMSEVPVLLPGLSHAPFFIGLNLPSTQLDFNGIALDANGAGTKTYTVPAMLPPSSYVAQALLLSASSGLPHATSIVAIL